MTNENPVTIPKDHSLEISAHGKVPALSLDMGKIREAERRLIEAKTVNPITYADLEHTFNESYRDLKRHLSSIGFALSMAEKTLEEAKANVLLDLYPSYLETTDQKDNADIRKAFLIRNEQYSSALDKINQLKALESNFDGKLKVMENVCRYMRKQMDLVLRSGLSNRDYYVTQGKK